VKAHVAPDNWFARGPTGTQNNACEPHKARFKHGFAHFSNFCSVGN
jgi:hypothetical protein